MSFFPRFVPNTKFVTELRTVASVLTVHVEKKSQSTDVLLDLGKHCATSFTHAVHDSTVQVGRGRFSFTSDVPSVPFT